LSEDELLYASADNREEANVEEDRRGKALGIWTYHGKPKREKKEKQGFTPTKHFLLLEKDATPALFECENEDKKEGWFRSERQSLGERNARAKEHAGEGGGRQPRHLERPESRPGIRERRTGQKRQVGKEKAEVLCLQFCSKIG